MYAGAKIGEQGGVVLQEGADSGRRVDERVERGWCLGDRVLDEWAGDRRESPKRCVEHDEHVGLRLRDGGDLRGQIAGFTEETGQAGALRSEILRHRLESAEERPQLPDRRVDLGPSAGQNGAELDQVLA